MEDSQEILLTSLASSGVQIPRNVSSIQDLTPSTLFSICSNSLRIITNTSSFPATLPDSMADRFKICTDVAASVKELGYIGDLSFHKFLYPSEEDMYKLVRFLVGRLSESSDKKNKTVGATVNIENFKSTPKELTKSIDDEGGDLHARLKDLRLRTEVESSVIKQKDDFLGEFNESDSVPPMMEEVAAADYQAGSSYDANDELYSLENGRGSMENFQDSRNSASGNGETVAREGSRHVSELEQTLNSGQENSPEMSCDIEKLRNQEKLLLEELSAKSLEFQNLQEEQNLLEAAVDMACSEQNPVDSYITQLNKQVDAKKHNLVELESKWNTIIKPLEEKKRSLEEVLCAAKPQSREKFQSLRKTELEIQSILSETKKRDEEHSRLSTEVEKQPKLASRRSYIEKIKEITKNSRKQDIDIERILKETRELQLESNNIQERLHRTYAVVDETVLSEAKKDQVGQQAYRLLTGIHESFEQISEKILATDRTHREASDYEAKLSKIASRSLNIDKLQVDLNAIRRENEFLQSRVDNT